MANSFGFGAGGTSTNGASYTGAAWVRTNAGSASGNLNITGSSPVTYESITINGSRSNCSPAYSAPYAYLNSGGGTMYFSRYTGNGGVVADSTGYEWTNGGLQGTVTWSTVPAAIGTPTATASTSVQGRIAISWTAPSDGGNSITNYRVFYETSANGTSGWSAKVEPTKTTSTSTSFNADSLTAGTYYRFYVNAVNARGTATYSTVSAVRMAPGVPGAPTGLTATRSTTALGSVDLSWTAPSVTAGGITGYNVYATPSGGTRTKIATLTGTGTTYSATGLTQRLSYTFDVTARNAFADTNSTESVKSNTDVEPASGVPSAPTSVTLVAPVNTDFALTLDWSAPTDTAGTLTGYYIYRTTSSTPYATINDSTSIYELTDLVPGVAYSFYVRARNTLSDLLSTSGVDSATVTATPTGTPSAPGAITVNPVAEVAGAVKFTWTPTVDTVSVNIYEDTVPRNLVATVKGTQYTIYGLTGGTERTYVLSTNNAFGESPVSTQKIVTPASGSSQAVASITVDNTTNTDVFNGTYLLTSVGATTFTYAKTYSGSIAETTVPTISGTTTFGAIVNNTNDNISITNGTISTSGPTSTEFSYTRELPVGGTLGDIPSGTPVSSVTAVNLTNALFNGTFATTAVDSGLSTVTYTVPSATVSSRAASGTVTNQSNTTYNGRYFISSATETEFSYNASTTGNTDQVTTASYGSVTNLTNKNMYNADAVTITSSPAYNKITYVPSPDAYVTRTYAFSTTTTASDPGSGNFRLNSGTVASVTRIYIDYLDSGGDNRTTWYKEWDTSTASVKGRLIIKSNSGASTTVFTVTGALTDSTGYFTGVITYVSGPLPTAGSSTITFIAEQDSSIITPYGQIRKANSTAQLDVRYRSGWLG